jgi:hypothetical protein
MLAARDDGGEVSARVREAEALMTTVVGSANRCEVGPGTDLNTGTEG